jgi:dethiobiotin synthetase
MKKFFVTAIHTDAGKTLVSALLTKGLNADYWKPIQSGIESRDSESIQKFIGSGANTIHQEAYLLKSPESPHSSAQKEGISIELEKINLPKTEKNLIIEGAGGLLVPINEQETIADLIEKLNIPIILVVPTYLGCINHSLLSLELIKSRKINLEAIIFNGDESLEAQKIILKMAGNPKNFHIPHFDTQNQSKFEELSVGLSEIFL